MSYWLGCHGLRPLAAADRIERRLARALAERGRPEAAADPLGWLASRRGDGLAWPHISRELHGVVSPARLMRLARERGIDSLGRGGRPLPTFARTRFDDPDCLARRYHREDATLRDIAAELGVHMRTVAQAMTRAGIERRRRGPGQ